MYTFNSFLSYLDAIKWNPKALLRGQKQAQTFILDNVRMLKFKNFPYSAPNNPSWKDCNFAHLFLMFLFPLRITINLLTWSYFDPCKRYSYSQYY